MASPKAFKLADSHKRKIDRNTAKKIIGMYEDIALEFEEKAKALEFNAYSDTLKKQYLNSMVSELNRSIDGLRPQLEDEIKTAGQMSAQTVVDAQNTVMGAAGLKLQGAYGYVPNKVVKNLVGGSLYEGNWNLSQALWKSGKKTKFDVQEIVAKGIAANKPVKDIAQDLTVYLRPGAEKPWDWRKVYPGTSEKVEYNSQRLTRTMVQHAYQQGMKESMKYNPFCKGVIWHSVFSHGRTCQLCKDRDGELYSLKNLPLDHPNGLCYFEPDLDDMDKIAKDIAHWVNNEKLVTEMDKKINEYAIHAFL